MSNEGKHVEVHYRGTLDDGTEFDSSYSRNQPLAFTCMAGQMIKGFDEAVKDMEVGQTVNVRLAPADAYGEKDPGMIHGFPKSTIPNADEFKVGDKVGLSGPFGQPIHATIIEINDTEIVVDANHEMAGKTLNFEITLLSVK